MTLDCNGLRNGQSRVISVYVDRRFVGGASKMRAYFFALFEGESAKIARTWTPCADKAAR
jgi:hypothetical protein